MSTHGKTSPSADTNIGVFSWFGFGDFDGLNIFVEFQVFLKFDDGNIVVNKLVIVFGVNVNFIGFDDNTSNVSFG